MKYWKSQGYSKKQVKEWCIDKCVKYVKNFNPIKDGPDLKKSIDKVWRDWKTKGDNPSKLREIDYVEFPKEVLDWFLSLRCYLRFTFGVLFRKNIWLVDGIILI